MKSLVFSFVLTFAVGSVALPQKGATQVKPAKLALFRNGAETFILQDKAGKAPQYRVLDDSASKRALAMVVITTLNMQSKVQPKIPVNQYIDVKLEKFIVLPSEKNPKLLRLKAQVSGHEIDLKQEVSKEKFLSGQPIVINFPRSTKDLSAFSVDSQGKLRFRLDKAKNDVVFEEAFGRVDFESPLSGEETESIRFTGRGVRQ